MATMDLGVIANEKTVFKRQFRWLFNISNNGTDYTGCIVDKFGEYGHLAKISARPSIQFNEIDVNHAIETVYLPSRATWNPITVNCYDIDRQSYLYQWLLYFYNPATGTVNPVAQVLRESRSTVNKFPKKLARLSLLDGHGKNMEVWDFEGCWPSQIDWGKLDYSSSGVVDLQFTLRYDRAVMIDPDLLLPLTITAKRFEDPAINEKYEWDLQDHGINIEDKDVV